MFLGMNKYTFQVFCKKIGDMKDYMQVLKLTSNVTFDSSKAGSQDYQNKDQRSIFIGE